MINPVRNSSGLRSFVTFGSLLAILVLMLAACDQSGQTQAKTSTNAGDQPTTQVTSEPTDDSPDASVQEVTQLPRIDAAGIKALIQEAAEADQVLVIDFWATWCIPCVQMFPELHSRLKARGDKVRVVSVTLDADAEGENTYETRAIRFLTEHHALKDAYLLTTDQDARLALPEQIAKQWRDLVVPAILVYDAEGQLAGEFLDGIVDPIVAKVDQVLPSP